MPSISSAFSMRFGIIGLDRGVCACLFLASVPTQFVGLQGLTTMREGVHGVEPIAVIDR